MIWEGQDVVKVTYDLINSKEKDQSKQWKGKAKEIQLERNLIYSSSTIEQA